MTAKNFLHDFLVNTVLTRQLHLYWQSFKVFTKNHSCIELWAIYTLQEENSDQDPSLTAQMEKMQISRNVSTGFPCHFTGGHFTLKMYLFRVTQLLVNDTLETEICPCCYVLMEQTLYKNWRAMHIEHLLPPPYSFLFFSRSLKSNFVDPFFPNAETFQKKEMCSTFPGGFE